MTHRLHSVILATLAACGLLAGAIPALAHPHVWVTVKSEIVYSPDGMLTSVRHAWTFDEMFSTFATQGIESQKKGEFTREELKALAEVNVSSLKEFGFFTFAKGEGKKLPLIDPVDYYLEYKDSMLTLNFTLPLQAAAKAPSLDVDIFDPDYFVDFTFAEKDPVALNGAPAACKFNVVRPGTGDAAAPAAQPDESFFQKDSTTNYGAQFANKISVRCP
ncbi:MAG TPA: DUF1007 family protein [Xanthobacteraceae bacterium]|jgi:ABC-type uncharacterized transport system substrate-binding protein